MSSDKKGTRYEAPKHIRNYFVMSYSANVPGYKILDYALDTSGKMHAYAKYIFQSFPEAQWYDNVNISCKMINHAVIVIMRENTFQIICRTDIYRRYFVKYGYVDTKKDLDD